MRETTREFLRNPPAGSKTRAAMDFGIDLTLTTRNMFALTPGERLERMQRDQVDVRPKPNSRHHAPDAVNDLRLTLSCDS